jgi:hypothetical protein
LTRLVFLRIPTSCSIASVEAIVSLCEDKLRKPLSVELNRRASVE